jgi:hypothetical protein
LQESSRDVSPERPGERRTADRDKPDKARRSASARSAADSRGRKSARQSDSYEDKKRRRDERRAARATTSEQKQRGIETWQRDARMYAGLCAPSVSPL